MRKWVLIMTVVAVMIGTCFAQKPPETEKSKNVAIVFMDRDRVLMGRDPQRILDGFQYFVKRIQEIAKRDFPEVELRIVEQGDMLYLPDGTRLNVANAEPPLGIVFSAPGKKRRVLEGLQTDSDFACGAAAFFEKKSAACPK